MQQTVAFGHRANAQAIRLGIVQANPVLGFIVEQGSGARSVAEQAEHYCRHVEREHGKQAADSCRRRLQFAAHPHFEMAKGK